MKYVVPFLALFGAIALINKFFILGGLILLFVGAILFLSTKSATSILELYTNMPTVWQDISETLDIGQKYWFPPGYILDFGSAARFYRAMENFEALFEIKIDASVVDTFELKYGNSSPFQKASVASARTKALYYFIKASDIYPERLPEIRKAVFARKKVGGKKKMDEEKDFKPAFI